MAIDLLSTFLPQAESTPSRSLILEIGTTFGPFTINLFSSRSSAVGAYTVVPATGIFTLTAHGLSNGTMVQVPVSTASTITDGLQSGQLYFIISATTNTFQLATSVGGSAVTITGNQPGLLYKCGTPYNMTNHKVWAWVKHLVTDADNNLVLDLQPSITGASLGFGYDWQITFTKTKEQTFSLTPSTNIWDLIIQFPDGTRRLLVEDTFVISLPATHPNLIS